MLVPLGFALTGLSVKPGSDADKPVRHVAELLNTAVPPVLGQSDSWRAQPQLVVEDAHKSKVREAQGS
jgi:hypothetical protein